LKDEHVQVIDRSFDLLDALADGDRSLTEICRTTGLSKGTAFRLLAGLAVRGLVIKDPIGSTYMLGPGILKLVESALTGIGSVATLGRSALEELSMVTSETVALHVQSGLDRVVIDEIPSQHSIRYASIAGSVAPIHVGASGVVLLAFKPEDQLERTLSLLAATVENLDYPSLETNVRRAQHYGWALSVGERVDGAIGISVPVLSKTLLLSLNVLGPASRLAVEDLEAFLPQMRATAAHLASLIDGPSHPRIYVNS